MSLGGSQYLELITVVDRAEAERDPLRRRLLTALDNGSTFATWALRTDSVEALESVVEMAAVTDGARERPDGVGLAWRAAYPREAMAGSGVPFFIQWLSDEHPGAGPTARPVTRVVVEDAEEGPARRLLESLELDVEVEVRDGDTARLVVLELGGLVIE